MKIQLSYLKGILIVCLSFFLLFYSCSSDVEFQAVEMEPPLTDVLTLELTFGAEDLPEEYLLAQPSRIAISPQGNIIVSDMMDIYLKVFDQAGRPIQIVGGPGEGPGKFEPIYFPTVSPTGYISVINELSWPSITYNLFAPDYTFVEKINKRYTDIYNEILEQYGWRQFTFKELHCYSPGVWLMVVRGEPKRELNDPNRYLGLFYEKNSKFTEIAIYTEPPERLWNYRYGDLVWTVPDDKRVVYYHPLENRHQENGTWYYVLTVYDLSTGERKYIKQDYTPVAIPDSVINNRVTIRESWPERTKTQMRKQNKEDKALLKKIKVYPPVMILMSDNKYIFVFTNDIHTGQDQVVEVIDCDSGKRLSKSYFPLYLEAIQNGYTYRIAKNDDGFYVIEKYRIDPAVYGK